MIPIDPDQTDEEVLEIIFETIQWLERGDFDAFADAVGYSFNFGTHPAERVKSAISHYRSPDFFPGVETFSVTDAKTATGGNPNPRKEVIWYGPDPPLGGAATVDLPLNGRWSDLQADFVFLVQSPDAPFRLQLEEIYSFRQRNREASQ